MAAIAAVALGVTLLLADHALSEASDVIVRGEADSLVSALVSDLSDEPQPATSETLQLALKAHEDDGLRYIALVDRGGRPLVEAGNALMGGGPSRPGQSTTLGHRVRRTANAYPPRRRGPRSERSGPPPLLVVELEPPVVATLRADLTRISIVAALAGGVLIALAIAFSRAASQLATVERQAAREQRLVALGSMSSVMAHELRNPLTSLKGHAQLLVENLEDGKNKTKAERVVAEAERLELLTTSLLDFVRDGPIDRRDVATSELVSRTLEGLAAERVTVDLTAAPETMRIDEARLVRAVRNLVENAIQATEDDAKVDLTISQRGAEAMIVVRDRGKGLPAGSEDRIFEPFITTRVRGTGLGLSVARRIAEQHRGSLNGENHPDGGAVFTLRFPLTDATTHQS